MLLIFINRRKISCPYRAFWAYFTHITQANSTKHVTPRQTTIDKIHSQATQLISNDFLYKAGSTLPHTHTHSHTHSHFNSSFKSSKIWCSKLPSFVYNEERKKERLYESCEKTENICCFARFKLFRWQPENIGQCRLTQSGFLNPNFKKFKSPMFCFVFLNVSVK